MRKAKIKGFELSTKIIWECPYCFHIQTLEYEPYSYTSLVDDLGDYDCEKCEKCDKWVEIDLYAK